MAVLEHSTFDRKTITPDISTVVYTRAVDENVFVIPTRDEQEHSKRWVNVTNQLTVWEKSPNEIDEDGWEFPSMHACRKSFKLAEVFRDDNRNVPLRVIPNGEGGIVFEYQYENTAATYEVDADGRIEFCGFIDSRLVNRHDVEIIPHR